MQDDTVLIKCINESAETLINKESDESSEKTPREILDQINEIGQQVTDGANAFLAKEYLYLGIFSVAFAVILGVTVDYQAMNNTESFAATNFPYTAIAFVVGSVTSIIAGYIGMAIAVYTNTRTTFQCCKSVNDGFLTAFRGGQVLGFVLVGLALLILQILLIIFKASWYDAAVASAINGITDDADGKKKNAVVMELTRVLFECIAGYGLGGSSVALFGRVGGGIYTKAADVGADLVGKTVKDLAEDDPSNPGTIADNVGDNVGDVAGMGADLFGSLAESTCAALVVSSTSIELITTPDALLFPLMVTASGIIASFVSVLCVHFTKVTQENVQNVLKAQIGLSTILMTAAVVPSLSVLPEVFYLPKLGSEDVFTVYRKTAFGCVICGLWSGMVIGFTTEYYTSNAYEPTKSLYRSCEQGPAPNIILGLALGYVSVIIPIIFITATIGYSFAVAGMYGVGLAALGMLGSLPVALSIDGYGPISDNAGGVAEMSGLPKKIREITDSLDAAGNTTAAVGKGFAIGSACLVGLALFGAFITRVGGVTVDILKPAQFGGLLMGAMLPYAFSAMTMKAVGDAAQEMMQFIIADFKIRQNDSTKTPDYAGAIKISTEASLKKMVAPGILVIGAPLFTGFIFGPAAVAGLLAGAIVSGVQVAISASNTGGAWDNAKKEAEAIRAKHVIVIAQQQDYDQDALDEARAQLGDDETEAQLEDSDKKLYDLVKTERVNKEMKVAAVVGDTVGDPLKDTSGPAINILIKLSAITSLVFGSYIAEYHLINSDPTFAK